MGLKAAQQVWFLAQFLIKSNSFSREFFNKK
jgi:hypothetical protein